MCAWDETIQVQMKVFRVRSASTSVREQLMPALLHSTSYAAKSLVEFGDI